MKQDMSLGAIQTLSSTPVNGNSSGAPSLQTYQLNGVAATITLGSNGVVVNGNGTSNGGSANGSQSGVRPVIERGASWSYNETRILLSLWGQDMVQRQLTNSKRTRHVWEKIAERIREHGFDRTADQVRTRVFNMIAEYRRILKNPTPERKKKCIFFDALHKIYQAKDTNGVKAALNNYEEDYNLDPIEFNYLDDMNDNGGVDGNGYNDMNGGDSGDGGDNEDKSEVFAYAMSPSQTLNGIGLGMNGHHHHHLDHNDDSTDGQFNGDNDEMQIGPTPMKRGRSDSNATLHFDNSSSALLIDRMFAHLAKETEVLREWVNLERDRLSQEVCRRKEEAEREERREKCFLQTLMKMQEQMFIFLAKQSSSSSSSSPQQPPPQQSSSSTTTTISSVSSLSSSSSSSSSKHNTNDECKGDGDQHDNHS